MAHHISGFELKFTSRTSWKAERRHRGHLVDVVPVTWTKGRRQGSNPREIYQQVWYQDADEMEKQRNDPAPFVVAVATAKNYDQHPHEFEEFRALFEVIATGAILSSNSIETRISKRVTG